MFKCMQILYEEDKEHSNDLVIVLPNGHDLSGAFTFSNSDAEAFLKYIRNGGHKNEHEAE